jgi:tripartite-type tricarboxylate transporter receptor subunit TctC
MRSAIHLRVASVALFFGFLVLPAQAQDLYKGKTINLYVGSGEGGPYDAYARLVGRHIGKHLPGNPSVVVQNMPGASGRRLMNFMYSVAPKDGTAIALVTRGVAFDPLMGNEPFDVQSIAWLGSANDETNVCMVWHTSPIHVIDDLHKYEMVVGTSGPASTDAIYPNVLKSLYGLKFKVVGGYKSATDTHLAMERGEVDGRCGISYDTLVALNSDWLRDKKIRILIQIGLDKVPALGDIPSVFDLAKTEEQRQIWSLWAAPLRMGRPFFAPPGMAADRVALLRRAFDATVADPELRAESAKMNLAVNASTGENIVALLKKVYATPNDVVAKAAAASKGK